MGLSKDSTGIKAAGTELIICKAKEEDRVVALAGNPNVGKSTVFNELTGMHQHTGNWPGKTVTNAQGHCVFQNQGYVMVDLPGCYSLMAHSAEEEVARDFICFGGSDAAIVVCDATCLERNLNLVLQTLELAPKALVCVNLMDEAKRRKISVDLKALSTLLGVPVIGASARSRRGLGRLMAAVKDVAESPAPERAPLVTYSPPTEKALAVLCPAVREACGDSIPARWLSLKLLEGDRTLLASAEKHLGFSLGSQPLITEALEKARSLLQQAQFSPEQLQDDMVSSIVRRAEEIAAATVVTEKENYRARDQKIDQILTSKLFGFPLMLLALLAIFWLTISGANYPSQLLSTALFWVGEQLRRFLSTVHTAPWLIGLLVDGMYRTLAWVVSVMLPPMAIFFPLFTLLEDLGYLPRVAFNLDKCFQKCGACGKQALTTCMGFGCNAAGVVGCRIIDSPRERLIAMLTNSFVPCNGRFPTLIALSSMFFLGVAGGLRASLLSALSLLAMILLGIFMTFAVSKFLSKTLLKGVPSSFTLELPPYRRPQVGKVIVRSIFDRTLFVLGRAVTVAIPAGLIIWIMANVTINGATLLAHCSGFLDPFARVFGMDGVILLAFLLGFPANEIVVPIILMAYLAQGSLVEMSDLTSLKLLLVENGWTWVTAACTILFSLMHWPCSTTCLTIRKESQSWKWTAAAFLIPTACGLFLCFLVATGARLAGVA